MKKLTFRYSLTQFTYWAASTGASGFATTYLLKIGLSSGFVGTLLAIGGIASCILQPAFADLLEKKGRTRLPQIMVALSMACAVCFGMLLIPDAAPTVMGFCYVVGILLSNIMLPLLNALCVSYEQAGYCINYGFARGIGSAASAVASLVLGYVIAQLGNQWMILLLISFRLLHILVLLGYPDLGTQDVRHFGGDPSKISHNFLSQYPWYCATLIGVLFLGMYHAMTENYMIAIMERLGGNSSHVGIALFLSSMVGAPMILCSRYIRQKMADSTILKVAACSFFLKSVLICFASSISSIYCIQLLQMTSYAFLEPTLVYYAKASVKDTDMLTGQAFSTAAYALGCAAGNFAGGQLVAYSMDAFFVSGIAMALMGMIILFSTVTKKDVATLEEAK